MRLDLRKISQQGEFSAPVIAEEADDADEHGTRVIVKGDEAWAPGVLQQGGERRQAARQARRCLFPAARVKRDSTCTSPVRR